MASGNSPTDKGISKITAIIKGMAKKDLSSIL